MDEANVRTLGFGVDLRRPPAIQQPSSAPSVAAPSQANVVDTASRNSGFLRGSSLSEASGTRGPSSSMPHPLSGDDVSASVGEEDQLMTHIGGEEEENSESANGEDASRSGGGESARRKRKSRATTVVDGEKFQILSVPMEYYRLRVLAATILLLFVSLPTLYTTPLLGLLLVPSSCLTIYWTINEQRFLAGGDIRTFINRQCSLMYLTVCGLASFVICAYDSVTLIVVLMDSKPVAAVVGNNQTTPQPVVVLGAAGSADAVHEHKHTREYYVACLIVNGTVFVAATLVLLLLRKLKKATE